MALFEEAKELLDISKPVNKAYPRAMAKEDKTRAGQLLRMVPSRFRPPAKNIRVPKGFQVVDNEAPDYEPVSGAAPARGPKKRSSKKASKASKATAPKARKAVKASKAPRKASAKRAAGEKDPVFRAWLSAQGASPKAAKKAAKKSAKKAPKKAAAPKKMAKKASRRRPFFKPASATAKGMSRARKVTSIGTIGPVREGKGELRQVSAPPKDIFEPLNRRGSEQIETVGPVPRGV